MDDASPIREFNSKLQQEWYRRAACGRRFVQADALIHWMKTPGPSGKTNTSRLLGQVMEPHSRQRFWVHLVANIENQDACLLVFAILLELGYGDLIDVFLEVQIRDNALPILTDTKRRLGKRLDHYNVANAEAVVDQFSTRQWSYCPVKLKLGEQGRFDAHESGSRVLPFLARQRVNEKGGTAEIWEVSVERDMMDPDLRQAISENEFPHQQHNRCYQMAIKSFRKQYEDVFEREKQAFIALKNHEGMVQYLGSFTHQDASGEETHNLLLEYGERDLIEFFDEYQSPVQPLEIIRFWEQLLKVAQALKRMHGFQYLTPAGISKFYYGWHSDIKPDNILRVRGEYKLADFGFSLFKEKKAGDSDKPPAINIEGHTFTYGPPEIDGGRLQSNQFGQGIDIWSLGAVLSIAATWVVHGGPGIEQFQELRERDIKNLRAPRDTGRAWTTPSADDSFHDGKSVLGSVLKWHQYLRLTVRKNDFITVPVLDLVEKFMLLEDPNSRIKSEELCESLQSLLDKAKTEARNPDLIVDEAVLDTILSVDEKTGKQVIQPKAQAKTQRRNENHSRRSPSGIDGVPQAAPQAAFVDQTPGIRSKPGKGSDGRRQFHVSKLAHPEVLEDGLGEAAKHARNKHRLSVLQTNNELPGSIGGDLRHPIPIPEPGPSTSHGPSELESYQTPSQFGDVLGEPTRPAIRLDTHYDGKEVSTASEPIFAVPKDAAGTTRRDSPLAHRQGSSFNSPSVLATAPESPIRAWYSWHDVHPGLNVHRVRTQLETSRNGLVNKLFGKSKKHETYKEFIRNRDIKFIVDNGITMSKYWKVATFTLTTLGMILAALDDDGVDLHFTMNHEHNLTNIQAKNLSSKFENAMEKAQPPPTILPDQPCETDMNDVLGKIFGNYLDHLSRHRWVRSKRMTLIILTDGIWGGTRRKHETVERKIGKFIQSVSKLRGEMEERQFSIEFVAFGDDPGGIQLLRELDDKASERVGIHDMIDTVHWTGSVRKMILGSIRDGEDEEEEGDPFMSPGTTNPLSPHNPSASNALNVTSQHIARSNSHNSKNSKTDRLSQFLSRH